MAQKKHTKRSFTYHCYNYTAHSRIDRIYVTKNLKILDTNIIANSLSDREMVSLTLQIKKQKLKGNGFWKLNTFILKEKNFKEIILKFWENWQKQKIQIHQWMVGIWENLFQSTLRRILKTTKPNYKTKITKFIKPNLKRKNKNITKPKTNKNMATRIWRHRKLQNTRYYYKR